MPPKPRAFAQGIRVMREGSFSEDAAWQVCADQKRLPHARFFLTTFPSKGTHQIHSGVHFAFNMRAGLVLVLVLAPTASSKVTKDPPSPLESPSACNVPSEQQSKLCDPEGLISLTSQELINSAISSVWPSWEIAVLAVRSLPSGTKSSQQLAEQVHNTWGVGSALTGNGVVIAISKNDREAFWSSGASALDVLSKRRVDTILEAMKPHLKANEFEAGLVKGVFETTATLACVEGSSSWPENALGPYDEHACKQRLYPNRMSTAAIIQSLLAASFLLGVLASVRGHRERSRARQALQRVDAVRMSNEREPCAICLEHMSSSAGSCNDSNAARPLPCGHVFHLTCIKRWCHTQQRRSNAVTCPVCRQMAMLDELDDQHVHITSKEDDDVWLDFVLRQLHNQYPRGVPSDVTESLRQRPNRSLNSHEPLEEQFNHFLERSRTRSGGESSTSFGGGTSAGGFGGRW